MTFRVPLLLLFAIAGCATGPSVMEYYPLETGGRAEASWPGPVAVPRLEYVGQLIGEQNFIRHKATSGGARFLEWLVGLGGGRNRVVQLVRPQSGVVDSLGRVLVTDSGRPSVFVFDEVNATYEVWLEAEDGRDFVSPVGIAELSTGGYLVADAELAGVFILSAEGTPLGRFTDDKMLRPTGVDVDSQTGEVFVADKGAKQVRVYSAAGAPLRTIGVAGTGPGELNAPMHIRVADDKLYVSDALNSYVQVFASRDGSALARIGQRGLYVGNLVRPKGVTLDSDGNVYVVESYYDHVLVYDQEGQFLLPVGGTGNEVGRFFLPAGIWSDHQDRIFVADMFNGRVMIFRYVGPGA